MAGALENMPTPDEARVLAAIARRTPFPEALLAQLRVARVADRRWTGVGLYVDLSLPASVAALPVAEPVCYGLTGTMSRRMCWFTLWLTEDRSRAQFLEVCTAGADDLPEGAALESLDEDAA